MTIDMRLTQEKIQNELGWKPLYSFEEGIKETISWYQTHQDWWEKLTTDLMIKEILFYWGEIAITTVLVTGAKGQLGSDLVLLLKLSGYKVFGMGKSELDITNEEEVNKVVSFIKPDIIVHCAAYTQVDKAESDPDAAFLINGMGTRNIAIAAERNHSKLVYISTDYVFNGSSTTPYHEFSPVSPINIYGSSKLVGETMVRDFHSQFFIVRTSWVFGLEGNNFVKTMLKLSSEKEKIRVVNDQFGSPTYTVDLSKCIVQIMETENMGYIMFLIQGIVHGLSLQRRSLYKQITRSN